MSKIMSDKNIETFQQAIKANDGMITGGAVHRILGDLRKLKRQCSLIIKYRSEESIKELEEML
jgi:hypothetical protein